MTDGERLERLLRSALVPVEPPEALSDRLERTLSGLTEAAAEELADLDPAAMRDPRNWARPAAAGVVGTMAGGAVVVVGERPAGAREERPRCGRGLRAAPAPVAADGRREAAPPLAVGDPCRADSRRNGTP
jgi:hypothetical protein